MPPKDDVREIMDKLSEQQFQSELRLPQMMAMALGDGAVENDRLIVMVYFVIDAVRKIRSDSRAVKTLYDQRAFQECGLLRIIAPRGSGLRPNPSRRKRIIHQHSPGAEQSGHGDSRPGNSR